MPAQSHHRLVTHPSNFLSDPPPRRAPLQYTLSTPNGQKVAIFCEELKAAYPSFNYQSTKIDFRKGVQKADWYREVCQSCFLALGSLLTPIYDIYALMFIDQPE